MLAFRSARAAKRYETEQREFWNKWNKQYGAREKNHCLYCNRKLITRDYIDYDNTMLLIENMVHKKCGEHKMSQLLKRLHYTKHDKKSTSGECFMLWKKACPYPAEPGCVSPWYDYLITKNIVLGKDKKINNTKIYLHQSQMFTEYEYTKIIGIRDLKRCCDTTIEYHTPQPLPIKDRRRAPRTPFFCKDVL